MGKLRDPRGAVGGKGFIVEEPTGNTSPSVVNQSAGLPVDASYFAVKPWSSTCTSMPPGGSWPGLIDSSASLGAQRNTPELPPEERCRHSSDISKSPTGSFVRITPTGCPVHFTPAADQVQVSAAQFTFVKSAAPRSRQPGAERSNVPRSRTNTLRTCIGAPWVWIWIGPRAGRGCPFWK